MKSSDFDRLNEHIDPDSALIRSMTDVAETREILNRLPELEEPLSTLVRVASSLNSINRELHIDLHIDLH